MQSNGKDKESFVAKQNYVPWYKEEKSKLSVCDFIKYISLNLSQACIKLLIGKITINLVILMHFCGCQGTEES